MLKYGSLVVSHTGTESDVTTVMCWLWKDFIFSLRLWAPKKEAQLYDPSKSQRISQKPASAWILETYTASLGLTSLCLGLITQRGLWTTIMLYFLVCLSESCQELDDSFQTFPLRWIKMFVTQWAVLYLRPLLTEEATCSPSNVTSFWINNDMWNHFGQPVSASRAALREELDHILIY